MCGGHNTAEWKWGTGSEKLGVCNPSHLPGLPFSAVQPGNVSGEGGSPWRRSREVVYTGVSVSRSPCTVAVAALPIPGGKPLGNSPLKACPFRSWAKAGSFPGKATAWHD